ncbi:unnamed protein product [Heligmosomoides polygyrus]|uniref:RBR-type E3 ubiquitin transferase n=1 Tax=Heligmosomoides polygyrus TaxID=6339 RepID=A0A3P8EMZ1_HELPZ|nr:unnamed protein product [Heligmosomoides polygyrus]
MLYNGFSSELKCANEVNNTAIVVGCVPECYQHDSMFESRIREVLEMNGIELKRAYLHHYSMERHDTNDLVRKLVSRTIVEYLMRRREWHGPVPLRSREWGELLDGNLLPWTWRPLDVIEDEHGARVGEGELTFKDVELGLRLLDLLTMDDLDLKFSMRDGPEQRILMKPLYCVGVGVTKEVRVACDAFIRHLNEEESSNARLAYDDGQLFSSLEIVDKTWTQGYYATDDCDTSEGELSVQGWPPEFGANYVEFVRKKLRGTAVIDVDLVGERITLVGQDADVARRKLEFFAQNPTICGGAKLKFIDEWTMEFSGTLEQHELLLNYLEEVDGRLISTSSKVNTTSKPNCPICLSPVSDAFYCLECGHYYCLKCIIYQVKTLIRNRDLPLRCFNVDCGKLLVVSDLKYLLLGDARLPWLNAKKVQCLLDSTMDCMLQKETSLRRCPTPDCYGLFMVATIEKNKVVTCDSCKRARCSACMVEPHEGVSCDEYAVLRSDEAASLRAYLKKKEGRVRQCPTETCGAYIEKGEGCNHMHCSMCNIHFCWICGFRDESQSKVYGHLRDKHGAIGEEWPLFGNALVEPFRPRRFPDRRVHFLAFEDDRVDDNGVFDPFVGLPF